MHPISLVVLLTMVTNGYAMAWGRESERPATPHAVDPDRKTKHRNDQDSWPIRHNKHASSPP